MSKGGTQTNGQKDKEINDYALGLTLEGWHRHTICEEMKEEEDSL